MKFYRVVFTDWRYGRTVGYSPYYKTKESCKQFITEMKKLPNERDFTGYEIEEFKPKYFSEKDVQRFKPGEG